MRRGSIGVFAILTVLVTGSAHAVPRTYTFTGRLAENGAPAQGLHNFEFELFATRTGGIAIWTETHTAVPIVDGMAFVDLGGIDPAGNPLDETILTGEELWIEVAVDGQVLGPRTPFRSVPYALRAAIADSVGSLAPGDLVTGVAAGNGLVGGGSSGDVSLAVDFAGSGSATTVARSDHDHDGTYLFAGTTLSCTGTNKVTGLDAATGNVVCGSDVDTTNVYTAGDGLSLSAGGRFDVAFGGSGGDAGVATTVARSDHLHDGRYPVAAGRSGGQTIYGGTDPADGLTLRGTAGAGGNVTLADDGGRVGVNTTSPGALLDVRYRDSSSNPMRVSDDTGLYRWRVDQFFDVYMTDATGADRMVIKNDGRIGVGTTTPAADVHVGSIRFGGRTFDRVTQCSFNGAASGGPSNFYRYWTAANCDNGLPAGNCVGFLSVAEHCGADEDWKVLLPGDSGPGGVAANGGMAWWTVSPCANPSIRAVYLCDVP